MSSRLKRLPIILLYFLGLSTALVLFLPLDTAAYQVTLAWNSNTESDLAGYKLYSREGTPGPPWTQIDTYPENELANPLFPMVEVTGLDNDINYYFVVTAYDYNGNESDYSNVVYIMNDGGDGGTGAAGGDGVNEGAGGGGGGG